MSVFSLPLSIRIREGRPYSSTAKLKADKTVEARLLDETLRYIISLLYPSTPPCTTIFQRINL